MVNQMIAKHKAVENEWLSRKLREEALQMALKYQFVTELTAMVVTDPEAAEAGAPESSSSSSRPKRLLLDDGRASWAGDDAAGDVNGGAGAVSEQKNDDGVETPDVFEDVVENRLSEKRHLKDARNMENDDDDGGDDGFSPAVAASKKLFSEDRNAAPVLAPDLSLSHALIAVATLAWVWPRQAA